jgi:hypothetical protein
MNSKKANVMERIKRGRVWWEEGQEGSQRLAHKGSDKWGDHISLLPRQAKLCFLSQSSVISVSFTLKIKFQFEHEII